MRFKKLLQEDNFLSLTGNLIIAVFGFAGFALLARSYDTDTFGQWVLYVSSGAFIEMFRFGITNTAIIRYLSGVTYDERISFIGSNYLIGSIATIAIMLLLWVILLCFPLPIKSAGYELFFYWYPILALVNLPLNSALVILQADQKFGKILLLRFIPNASFFIVVLFNYLTLNLALIYLIWIQIAIYLLTSLLCMISGWDGLQFFKKASGKTNRLLLNFGKYTTFTLIGSNLLRSADTLIISLSPMGTAAVALYSIPMKLIEIQQIPLRSFVATAFPKLSKASIQNDIAEVKKLFYTYSGAMTILFIFISLFSFVFAEFLVRILGGENYLGTDPVTGFNTTVIVRIFAIYGLLLPIDRMTGVGLDSINRPKLNFIKVLFMVIANVTGDIIAVFIFKSLAAVAVASIAFTLVGILLGYLFIDKYLQLEASRIYAEGIEFYMHYYKKFRRRPV